MSPPMFQRSLLPNPDCGFILLLHQAPFLIWVIVLCNPSMMSPLLRWERGFRAGIPNAAPASFIILSERWGSGGSHRGELRGKHGWWRALGISRAISKGIAWWVMIYCWRRTVGKVWVTASSASKSAKCLCTCKVSHLAPKEGQQ